MAVDNTLLREGEPIRLSRRQSRVLKRRSRQVQVEVRLYVAKVNAIHHCASIALRAIAAASDQEAQVVQDLVICVDRAQFIVDKTTYAVGREIKMLSQHLDQI